MNKLTKFHLIFSDDYEKKIHPFDSTPICVFVACSIYPTFLFCPSISRVERKTMVTQTYF